MAAPTNKRYGPRPVITEFRNDHQQSQRQPAARPPLRHPRHRLDDVAVRTRIYDDARRPRRGRDQGGIARRRPRAAVRSGRRRSVEYAGGHKRLLRGDEPQQARHRARSQEPERARGNASPRQKVRRICRELPQGRRRASGRRIRRPDEGQPEHNIRLRVRLRPGRPRLRQARVRANRRGAVGRAVVVGIQRQRPIRHRHSRPGRRHDVELRHPRRDSRPRTLRPRAEGGRVAPRQHDMDARDAERHHAAAGSGVPTAGLARGGQRPLELLRMRGWRVDSLLHEPRGPLLACHVSSYGQAGVVGGRALQLAGRQVREPRVGDREHGTGVQDASPRRMGEATVRSGRPDIREGSANPGPKGRSAGQAQRLHHRIRSSRSGQDGVASDSGGLL